MLEGEKVCKIYRAILPRNIYEPPSMEGATTEFTLFQGASSVNDPTDITRT